MEPENRNDGALSERKMKYRYNPNSDSTGMGGPNAFAHILLNGPMNYNTDSCLFKVFPITELTSQRFSLNAFNALNTHGYNNPDTIDSAEILLSFYWTVSSSGSRGGSSSNQLTNRLKHINLSRTISRGHLGGK